MDDLELIFPESKKPLKPPKKVSSKLPSKQPTKKPLHHDTTVPRHHDAIIEQIRMALKNFGKEAATHRFTLEEKKAIRKIVFSYNQMNISTIDLTHLYKASPFFY